MEYLGLLEMILDSWVSAERSGGKDEAEPSEYLEKDGATWVEETLEDSLWRGDKLAEKAIGFADLESEEEFLDSWDSLRFAEEEDGATVLEGFSSREAAWEEEKSVEWISGEVKVAATSMRYFDFESILEAKNL